MNQLDEYRKRNAQRFADLEREEEEKEQEY